MATKLKEFMETPTESIDITPSTVTQTIDVVTKATANVAAVNMSWGTITGTLSDQTDLQSALDAKQATLVSGTNIKTINGNSILGSGNLQTITYEVVS